jgi:hypothetical protein
MYRPARIRQKGHALTIAVKQFFSCLRTEEAFTAAKNFIPWLQPLYKTDTSLNYA